MVPFLIKKCLSPLCYPLPLGGLLLVVGVLLLWFSRGRERAGKILVSVGTGVILLFSYGQISECLTEPLEVRYEPYCRATSGGVDIVLVLGAGHRWHPEVPPTSQLSGDAMIRLVEGIRIHRENPGSRLLVSGGGVFSKMPEAVIMAEVAPILGVDPGDILQEPWSRDTEEEAEYIRPMVGDRPFALVTSAVHMPRSMALFENLGMHPIPAPCAQTSLREDFISPGDFFPKPSALEDAEAAIHEYLGLVWARLRGRI